MYTIKQVAEQLQVSANAIRFYEKKGLITPTRKENGYRYYSDDDILNLQTIWVCRTMGFSIEMIHEILEQEMEHDQVRQYALQYELLEQHIHSMRMLQQVLGDNIESLLKNHCTCMDNVEKMKKVKQEIVQAENWKDRWNFDGWAGSYDHDIKVKTDGMAFYQNYDKVLQSVAFACLSGNSKYTKNNPILEIGIGTGNLAEILLREGVKPEAYFGLDQSVAMLCEAAKKCENITLRPGSLLQLPFLDHSIGAIISTYTMHHCNEGELKLAISEMDRVLKENGKIVLSDIMFLDKAARSAYEQNCTDQQRMELFDEFFHTTDVIKKELQKYGYSCSVDQIDDLIFQIEARKNGC